MRNLHTIRRDIPMAHLYIGAAILREAGSGYTFRSNADGTIDYRNPRHLTSTTDWHRLGQSNVIYYQEIGARDFPIWETRTRAAFVEDDTPNA